MIAVLEMLIFLGSGLAIGRSLFRSERRAVRLWLGLVLGLVLMMWLPALFSFLLGFVPLSQHLGALVSAAAAGVTFFKNKQTPEKDTVRSFAWLFAVVPVFAFCVVLLFTHVLKPDALGDLSGGQSTWGDMCLHLGFITSLSVQGNFPPMYSIIPNTPVGYPFLCDSISATLHILGLSLRASYLLPMLVAFFVVLSGAFFLFETVLKDSRKAAVGFVLFFLGGGFGFAYFLDHMRANPDNFLRIFSAFYETPTNLVEQNIRWVNPIADLMIPQRATLFGWVVLFACLFLLYRAVFEKQHFYFWVLGVLAGALPMIHTHSFLALGMISAVLLPYALVRDGVPTLKRFAPYVLLALILALPQLLLFTFRQSAHDGFLRWHLNWANDTDNYFWFYVKNIGLVYVLLIPAFLSARKEVQAFYGASLLILVLCEFVVFQPNEYDNNKLLYVWHLLGCGLVGGYMVDVFDRLKGMKGRVVLASITLFVCVLGGLLTLGRETVSELQLFTSAEVDAANYIENKTAPNSLFATADNHNNTVASLTGRNIVRGSGSYLFFHGVDNPQVERDVQNMFEVPAERDSLFAQYNVDYLYVSDYERGKYLFDEFEFAAAYPVAFDNGEVTIYAISSRASEAVTQQWDGQ